MTTLRKALSILILTFFPIALGTAVRADCGDGSTHGYFSLSTSGYGYCEIAFGPPPFFTVQVLLNSVPATKARFSLPDPPFGTVVGEGWNYPATGNRTTGIELDLGACAPGQTEGIRVLGTLFILLDEPIAECTPWQVGPVCEIEVCDGAVRPAVAKQQVVASIAPSICGCCFQCCEGLPAHTLYPAGGATKVPTNVTLSWSGGATVPPEAEPFFYCSVRISTDPACGSGQTFQIPCADRTLAPNFLQPATTYYWQVGWAETSGSGCSSGAEGYSAIHSFTTGDPVAVETSTWGRVKALYRN